MQLAYREFGSGKPLIILHGLFGQGDNWNTLAKKFAENGFRVFILDQRNHGLSPHSEEWNYQVMAEDLKDFILEKQLDKPILLGHSMGGKTVLFFNYLFPLMSNALIIVDIAARAYKPHHQKVLEALHAVNFNLIKTRKEAEQILNEHISDFGTKQFLLKNIYWKENSTLMGWRFNLKVISEKYDNIGVAVPKSESSLSTLIIRGEKSDYITDEDYNDFQQRFTQCKLATIADAGHWVHAENPNAFFETVIKFVKDSIH